MELREQQLARHAGVDRGVAEDVVAPAVPLEPRLSFYSLDQVGDAPVVPGPRLPRQREVGGYEEEAGPGRVPRAPRIAQERAVHPDLHRLLRDGVVPPQLREARGDRVEGAAPVHVKGVVAHGGLDALPLLGVSGVGAGVVRAVQLALAACACEE